MKITDIQIERFGVWQDLRLPLRESGINVVYGPNEAGKTTLMRFIRSILYGRKWGDIDLPPNHRQHRQWSGSLRVVHQGRHCEIQRSAQPGQIGELAVHGFDHEAPAEERLSELTSGTGETLFDFVFSIGLYELQELATLHDDEVAQHIYGMSLGPEGQRLLDCLGKIDTAQNRLLDAELGTGQLADLFERYEQICGEIQYQENCRQSYLQLLRERQELESRIADFKHRQKGLQSQLRGHLFLDLVWGPWNRVRKCEQELDSLPIVSVFPENGLARLAEFDDELNTANRCRDALLKEAAQLRKQAEALNLDPEIQKHASGIQGFLDQRDWLEELEEQLAASDDEVQRLKADLDRALGELGGDWSLERLRAVDASHTALFRLMARARQYQSAMARRAKLRKRYKHRSDLCHQRSVELNERCRPLGGLSIKEAIAAARQRIDDLEELGRLRRRESELQGRRTAASEKLARLHSDLAPPKWVNAVLWSSVGLGLLLAGAGVYAGLNVNALAGVAYALLGVTFIGYSWAYKKQTAADGQEDAESLQQDIEELDSELQQMRESVARLQHSRAPLFDVRSSHQSEPMQAEEGSAIAFDQEEVAEAIETDGEMEDGAVHQAADSAIAATASQANTEDETEADLIVQAVRELAHLEQLQKQEQSIRSTRRKLTVVRGRFQELQREVSAARQSWCELLVQLGLDETVRINETFETWRRIVEADERRRQWEAAKADRQKQRDSHESFRRRIMELGHRMNQWDVDYQRPLPVLDAWKQQLKTFADGRQERQRLQGEIKSRQREAGEYRAIIDETKLQRSALLVQGGAASADEFEQRAEWFLARQELEEQLAEAQAELETAARSESELAIVEEDLLAHDPDENAECIVTLQLELDDLAGDLQAAFEELGSTKQEMKALESDRRSTQLRFEREQITTQLKQAAQSWFAVQWASRAVGRTRSEFERTCQPEMLAAASHWLRRLTCGKYVNIWTPLGQRQLCIEDDHGFTRGVSQLSGGTREQLFLAIRLALLDRFSREGVELPIVLDDVIVNFDQLRTEAAVNTLLELAGDGRQVLLFTCHLHLAHLFESKGVEPIWLPGHHPPMEERLAG
jgi:uncharacterized protein YhaN